MKFNIKKTKKESFIWRLDPRLKILSTILFFILIFLPTYHEINCEIKCEAIWGKSLTLYFFLVFLFLYIFFISKLPWKTFKVIFKSSLIMMIFLLIFNSFNFGEGDTVKDVLFKLDDQNYFIITKSGIASTIYYTFRVMLVILVTVVFVSTTTTKQMTTAIESLLKPLKYLKFPVHIFAMIITLSLRLVPTIMEESENIIIAQASRGLDFRRGNWKTKIKSLISLLIPLIVSILRRADEMTIAMESRGYNPDKPRTKYFENQFKKQDWLTFFIILFVFGILVFCLYEPEIQIFFQDYFPLEKWLDMSEH